MAAALNGVVATASSMAANISLVPIDKLLLEQTLWQQQQQSGGGVSSGPKRRKGPKERGVQSMDSKVFPPMLSDKRPRIQVLPDETSGKKKTKQTEFISNQNKKNPYTRFLEVALGESHNTHGKKATSVGLASIMAFFLVL
jgi:hypothetical protein